MNTPLTIEEVRKALPPSLKSNATDQFVDHLNSVISDPVVAQEVRDNFISYASVLRTGKYKTDDYLNAVVYVSHKLMGKTNEDAYAATFPTRYRQLVAANRSRSEIASYVSMYNKGKLVNAILQQTMTPSWVLNQALYQKALNVQADLMENATSEKVRTDAADSLIRALTPPEPKEVNVNIGVQENSGLNELKDMMERMAHASRQQIADGAATTRDIAAMPLIEGSATLVKEQ
jgi:hypothetical protein